MPNDDTPSTAKFWSPAEDEFLERMNRQGRTYAQMRQRFNCSTEEIESRLAFLAAKQQADREREALEVKKQYEARPPMLMDAIGVIGTKLCADYDAMGQNLQKLVELVTSNVSQEECTAIIQAYLEGAGVAAKVSVNAEALAASLLKHFVIIPRVMLQVVPAQPATAQTNAAPEDASRQPTAADTAGDIRGEAGADSN